MNVISDKSTKQSSEIDGRLTVRQRFKLASEFLTPVRRLIDRGFATKRKGKTAFGRAMSYLLLRAVAGEYPNQYVCPEAVRLSEGVLMNPIKVEVVRQGQWITLETTSWSDDADLYNQSWDDQLVVCAYHPGERVAGINETPCTREERTVSLQLPPLLADKPVHLYLMVHDRAERRWSNSKYLGEV